MDQFSAVMMSCLRADLAEIAEIAGRPLTADDMEPMTWLYYETSGGYDGGAYVHAVAEMHRWTRRVVSWWADDGFDLLLTPTLAEPPPVLGDVGRQDDGGLQRGGPLDPVRGVRRAVQRDRPARDVGAAVLERRRACRSACSSSGAPFREDLLIRVAAQLEASTAVGRSAAHPCTPERVATSRSRAGRASTATRRPRSTRCSPKASTTSASRRSPS